MHLKDIIVAMIFRLSQKLADRVKVSGPPALPPAADPLTDWSAHLFNVSRAQYIFACNTKSLYSILICARGVNDSRALIVSVLRAIADAMEADGLRDAYQHRIAPASGVVEFGKTISRSVTGSMNDLIQVSKWMLADETVSLHEVGLQINITPLSMLIGDDGRRMGNPREVMRRLIADR